MALPQDRVDQVYVSIKAIQVGDAYLPDKLVYKDCEDADIADTFGARVPVFTFLITHPTRGKAMFDLGIRKVVDDHIDNDVRTLEIRRLRQS